MQRPNIPYYPDQYTYNNNPQFQTPQPQFYSQNPYHHHPQIQFTEPGPPGAERYYQSYPNTNPYSHSIASAAADVAGNTWEAENLVQHYGGDAAALYDAAGGTVPQDGSKYLVPEIPSHSNWPNQKSTVHPRGPWKKIPKKTKIAQSAWCEVCKLECNTKDVLDQHKLGKKHQKILVKLNSAALVASISAATHVNPVVPSNPIIGPSENPKKGTSRCEICKIECNTKDVLDQHKLGKKHQKTLVKLNSAALVAGISATTHVNPVVPSNPMIGPSENPKKGTSGSKKKAETPQELEMKRRKVLEGGTAASAVRTCSFCNVVCNSDMVFRFHLAGQKHASMLKKLQQAAVAGTV